MAGRPTKYDDEMQKKADEYARGGFSEEGDVVPSVAGLGLHLGVTRSTVYEWAEHHDQFSDTLGLISSLQERISLNGGMENKFNSTIVKLLLANHGYSERTESHHTGHVSYSDLSESELDRKISELMKGVQQ